MVGEPPKGFAGPSDWGDGKSDFQLKFAHEELQKASLDSCSPCCGGMRYHAVALGACID